MSLKCNARSKMKDSAFLGALPFEEVELHPFYVKRMKKFKERGEDAVSPRFLLGRVRDSDGTSFFIKTSRVYSVMKGSDEQKEDMIKARQSLLKEARISEKLCKIGATHIIEAKNVLSTKRTGDVVVVYEMHPCSLMEYCSQHRPSLRAIARWVHNLVIACHWMSHYLGFAHCDIKPDNCLMTSLPPSRNPAVDVHAEPSPRHAKEEERAALVLCDFESTAAFDTCPESYTLRYAAPELLGDDSKVHRHTDTWGIGMMLFYLLFNRPPVWAKDEETREDWVNVDSAFHKSKVAEVIHCSKRNAFLRIPLLSEKKLRRGKEFFHAMSLLFMCLRTDPDERPPVNALKMHPFFSKHRS